MTGEGQAWLAEVSCSSRNAFILRYCDGMHALYNPVGQQWQICTSVQQCSVADVMFIVPPAVWLPHAAS